MIKSKPIILFDLDGTLIDSTQAIVKSFKHSFEQNSFEFKGKNKDITNLIGYPLEYMFEALKVPNDKIDIFIKSYKKLYRQINQNSTKLLPNALKSIKLANSFATLGIVTTKTTRYTLPMLKEFGILHFFDTIIGRQEVIYPKPHPEPILKAIENLNTIQSKHIYMIGDTILDMMSAKDANICGIGVLCGYGTNSQLSKYSQIVVDDTFEAVQIIKNLFENDTS
ncbi:MAG: HAD family hydrolase [Epsilonproteobacteria bacterium]|nr:MAG: HAD family hydrolase [Campylobacterota bacterium]